MDRDELLAASAEERQEFYKQKIAEHSPATTEHNKRMIQFYQQLMEPIYYRLSDNR
ncbi:MAG: hypothetical protein KZQ93_13695 [Candidatus Thiodiazotropha sp. (ex Monitilora ramsayi)]|nr:hypothetical protein [Candidatus Thiodiazotropha sp. (ex Monitilora ramsayi)]